jgi:regulator of protease activity HflC (stomatin/prohibitin superfamily)
MEKVELNMTPMKIIKWIVAGVSGIVAIFLLGGTFYTVDEGERGVILRNGKVIGTAAPGLNFKLPVIDQVKMLDVKEGARVFEKLLTYSRDQQVASMQVSVNFRVPFDQVETVYSTYGTVENMIARVVDRQVPEEVKNVFGRFNASTAIQERDRLSAEIQAAIKKGIDGPIIVESVQTENIDFSTAYEKSIEDRMLAEVEVQKITQNAEREKVQAGIKVIQAQADADSKLAIAKAEATAIKMKGDALTLKFGKSKKANDV